MQKKLRAFAHDEKNQEEPHKQYKKRFRIYPAFLYSQLDKWLKKESLSGWHIVHCGIFLFWFEKGTPMEKEYFTYGLGAIEGKYSISLRYPFLEKTYGMKKDKSRINSNETKKYQIVEIDLNRIDVKNDVGYKELVNDRNRLYFRYFIRNFCIILISILVLILLRFLNVQ